MADVILYWTDPDTGLLETVEFDVVESETHEDTLELTRHPIEVGASTTDHAIENPNLVTLEIFMSNVPNKRIDKDAAKAQVDITVPGFAAPGTQQIALDIPTAPLALSPSGLIQAGIGAVKSLIAGQQYGTFRGKARKATQTLSATMLQQTAPRDRVRDVYEKLQGAQGKRALITAQTALRGHFDMILTRLPAVQSSDTGRGASFSIDLERIKVAESDTVRSPEPAEKRAGSPKSAGSKNGKADPNADAKNDEYESAYSQLTP